MEQHPVPQNVTTFQFRLIGDMTIKQFGYLAAGAIAGYICYKLPLPFFFTWPLAISSVVLGIGLAFVPIEERPMDVWLLSFIKSIYSPTQYLWSRQAGKPTAPTQAAPPAAPSLGQISAPTPLAVPAIPGIITTQQAASVTQTLEHLFVPKAHLAATPQAAPLPAPQPTGPGPSVILSQQHAWEPFGFLKSIFSPTPRQQVPQAAPAQPKAQYPDVFAGAGPIPSLTGKKVDLTQAPPAPTPNVQQQAALASQEEAIAKEKTLTEQLQKVQAELATKTTSDTRILELQKQLTDMLSERGQMERELAQLRSKLTQATVTPQVTRQAGVVTAPVATQPTVRVITPETAVKAGLPRLTTFANVVTGIIKDAEGNLLPGVLVTVRDKDEIPVRALKTNKLGQFAASTQLPNGVYTIDIEDPRGLHFFDRIRTTLMGAVMAPVEVVSKSKKEMDRTKLAAEIFGTTER